MSITAGHNILVWPQYVEETTPGNFPSNATLNFIAPYALFEQDADLNHVFIPGLGSRDVRDIIRSLEMYGFTMRFFPIDTEFLKYATNLSLDMKTLSLEAKINLGGTTKYWRASFAKANYATLTWTIGDLVRAEVYMVCRKPSYLSSSTSTFASDPGTQPLSWADGGDNPFTIGTLTPKVQAFSVTIRNNLRSVFAGGSREFITLHPGERRINGTITILWEDTNYWDLLVSDEYKDIVWTLKSGSPAKTLTLANAKFSRINRFPWTPGSDVIAETYAFFAKTAALT
ncbi:MAG: phage tail tube protein [Candidatus Bathyarchaeia archaeon]